MDKFRPIDVGLQTQWEVGRGGNYVKCPRVSTKSNPSTKMHQWVKLNIEGLLYHGGGVELRVPESEDKRPSRDIKTDFWLPRSTVVHIWEKWNFSYPAQCQAIDERRNSGTDKSNSKCYSSYVKQRNFKNDREWSKKPPRNKIDQQPGESRLSAGNFPRNIHSGSVFTG